MHYNDGMYYNDGTRPFFCSNACCWSLYLDKRTCCQNSSMIATKYLLNVYKT